MRTKNKTAYIYARTATSKSDEESNCIHKQIDAIRRYAFKNGFAILGEYEDIASGITLDRPGIAKLLSAVQVKTVDAILVQDIARLSRDFRNTEVLFQYFIKQGTDVISVADGCSLINEVAIQIDPQWWEP